MLSNRRPPYGITGGLYDALKATGGEFFVSTNAMARKARKLFHELEGVDIYSAAGVALASLINAVAAGKVEKDATVMLNVTGGGEEHFKEGKELWSLRPSHVFPLEPDTDDVVAKVEALFNGSPIRSGSGRIFFSGRRVPDAAPRQGGGSSVLWPRFPSVASPVSRRLPHVPVHFPVPGKKTAAKAGILPETIIFAAVSGGRRAAGPLTGSSDFFLLLSQQIQDEKHPNQADSQLQAL